MDSQTSRNDGIKGDSVIEFCVRCGKPTPYDQSTPVTARRYFVEGAGQLCPDCWRRLYERGNQLGAESSDTKIEADLK